MQADLAVQKEGVHQADFHIQEYTVLTVYDGDVEEEEVEDDGDVKNNLPYHQEVLNPPTWKKLTSIHY